MDGPTGGVPVVYLHGGTGEESRSFATLVGPTLDPSLRMVYLDQRGSGRSERPWTRAYASDLVADDLEPLRRAWGVPKLAARLHHAQFLEYPDAGYFMFVEALQRFAQGSRELASSSTAATASAWPSWPSPGRSPARTSGG